MIADLANLGAKSEAMLHRAGITTVKRLRELGAVRAYVKVKDSGARPSLNLLWALEGALTGRSWQEVAKTERLRLLLQLDDLACGRGTRSNFRSNGSAASAEAHQRPAPVRRSP